MLCLLAVVLGLALWYFFLRAPLEEGLPRGAKDMTHLLSNPCCDPDKLDAWTFAYGGVTLAEDSTLMYYMKKFDVYQVLHGLPAGEYELRVKAWQSPDEQEVARYAYEQAEDKEDGCVGTDAEIYAGPFAKKIRNYYSDTQGKWDNALRFVVLDDSVRIGFRSDENLRRFSLAVADNFRLFLIRKVKSETELQELAALRDSAQAVDNARPQKQGWQLADYWEGHVGPMPEGWITEQEERCCRLVHKSDVGRGFGDSDIYLEYLNDKPAKPGLLLGYKASLDAGQYNVGDCFFAQNRQKSATNVRFVIKGTTGSIETTPMMDYRFVRFELNEPQEVIIGLYAPEGSDVCRAGLCMPAIWRN